MSLELTDWDLKLILDALEKDREGMYYYGQNRHIHTRKMSLIIKIMNEIDSRRLRGDKEEKSKPVGWDGFDPSAPNGFD